MTKQFIAVLTDYVSWYRCKTCNEFVEKDRKIALFRVEKGLFMGFYKLFFTFVSNICLCHRVYSGVSHFLHVKSLYTFLNPSVRSYI